MRAIALALEDALITELLWARDRGRCRYCGRDLTTLPRWMPWEADHVLPRCQGGDGGLENLVLACRRCNRRKGGRTPEEAGMPLLPLAEAA